MLDESTSSGQDSQPLSFKVAIVGDGSVGKSSICNRFCQDFFAEQYKQTLGVDFFSRTIQLPTDQEISFNLFDIGGQSVGSKMLKTYASGAKLIIYVFDLTNMESLLNMSEWHQKVAQYAPEAHCILVGNKSDLTTLRTVGASDIQEYLKKLNIKQHYLLSARTGDRVQMMFVSAAGALIGQDLTKMMLDQRKVVSAVIPEEKQATANEINRLGGLGIKEEDIEQDGQKAKKKKKGICSGQ
ncbi:Rab28/RabF [Spironucleus salmonicida]|uniref:RabF n=1 Tax=Spironucleus salmonicida TaxID=348837 RepID=V6LK69_9EUKA|nr:Rab28/RabF [Spironucleus salmonicida]|eukprot:EST45020.1 RabF [Spironucleus salmonicida]